MRAMPRATITHCEIPPSQSPPRENMISTNTGYWDLDKTLYPLNVAIGNIFSRAIHNPHTLYTFQIECAK